MSQTDKLLSNIQEYRGLLSFLKDNYPAILDEWKFKWLGLPDPAGHPIPEQAASIPGVNQNNARDR